MRTVILTALLPLAALALGGAAVADPNLCTTSTSCTFHCHRGNTIYVQLYGPVGTVVHGEAFCGGVGILCTGAGQGSASSLGHVCSFVVTEDGTGTCWHHQGWFTACGNTPYAN